MSSVEPFCPYVGLQPYTEAHQDYFFGRGREQRVISSNLYAAPLTILYGPSGVGKSSILRAGVMPHLQAAPRTAVVYFNLWQDPSFLDALKSECLKAAVLRSGKSLSLDTGLPLDEFLCVMARAFRGSILILLDQFEEYFLYQPESHSDNIFDVEFARAVNREDSDAGFLISLREDWLSKLDRFLHRVPNLLANTLRLEHLNAAAAKDAIQKPLAVYETTFPEGTGPTLIEDELVSAVLEQVRTDQYQISQSAGVGKAQFRDKGDEIETAFLQLVMTRLWKEEEKANSHVLRLGTLRNLGGAKQIVQTHLDNEMLKLSDEEREICARMFQFLVTPAGTKISHALEDLIAFADSPAERVTLLLEKLASPGMRILRRITPPERYEIFHDVLAQAVLDWRTRHVQAQEQAEAERKAREQARSAKRFRRMAIALAVLFALALASAVWAWIQREQAQRNERVAEARSLEAQAAKSQTLATRNNFEAYRADLMGAGDEAKKLWSQAKVLEREARALIEAAEQKLGEWPAGQLRVAQLTVKTEPEAYIFVNEEPKTKVAETGKSEALELNPGAYTIKVAKDEFKTLEHSITLPPDNTPQELELKLTRIRFAPEFLDAFLEGKKYWSAPESWRVEKGKMLVTGAGLGSINGKFYKDFKLSFDIQLSNRKGALWILRAQDDKNYYLFQLLGPAGAPPNSFRTTRYKSGRLELINTVRVNQDLGHPSDWLKITAEANGNRISHLIEVSSQPSAEGAQKLAYMEDNSFSYGSIGFGTQNGEEFYLGPVHVMPLNSASESVFGKSRARVKRPKE